MKISLKNTLIIPSLFFAYLFLFSVQSFGRETIYHFDFKKGSYFGEMYHVALGLISDPDAFVYLPFISELPKDNRLDRLKQLEVTPAARQALLIYGFFQQIGLTNRIVSEPAGIPPSGKEVTALIGKDKPNGSGKFTAPVSTPLADATQAFERYIDQGGEEALKEATSLFTRSGNDPPEAIKTFVEKEILAKQKNGKPFILIWNRQDPNYQIERNMTQQTLTALVSESILRGYIPLILGPPIDPNWKNIHQMISEGTVRDLTEIWKKEPFNSWENQVVNQIDFIREMKQHGRLLGQIGMKGGALDGPALAAKLPTIELVIPEDTKDQAARSRRILRLAKTLGNMNILQVDKAGSVRDIRDSVPVDWLKMLAEPQELKTSCRALYQVLGLRVKEAR